MEENPHIHKWEKKSGYIPGPGNEICMDCGKQRMDNGEDIIYYDYKLDTEIPNPQDTGYGQWLSKQLREAKHVLTRDGIRLSSGNYVVLSPDDKQDIVDRLLVELKKPKHLVFNSQYDGKSIVLNIKLHTTAERTADFMSALATLCDQYVAGE